MPVRMAAPSLRVMQRPVRTLLFSTLYPSAARPVHGIFVETRLRELLKTGAVQTRVVAPVPWFPSTAPRWGEWSRMAATPISPMICIPPRMPILLPSLSPKLAIIRQFSFAKRPCSIFRRRISGRPSKMALLSGIWCRSLFGNIWKGVNCTGSLTPPQNTSPPNLYCALPARRARYS